MNFKIAVKASLAFASAIAFYQGKIDIGAIWLFFLISQEEGK